VIVAMDNCPHQCVAVGPTHLVAAVESALTGRGVICERLPFRRPYHTPLFEPWMGPLRELFADVPFAVPHTPVYCCSTGTRFPDDPATIHQRAVNHWVSPVEFTRMIETMYADGVRLFVEAGPRGNLSAFIEDILRGRPFAAIPANVPRKSGPMQINHMVAQLLVHHVPLELGCLFADAGEPVEWEAGTKAGSGRPVEESPRQGSAEPAGHSVLSPQYSVPPATSALLSTGDNPDAVVTGYLDVMEQFLDVQRQVMEAFLAGHTPTGELPPLDGLFTPDLSAFAVAAPQPPAFALVGSVEQFTPGQSIVVPRTLDEREDLFADDHTLGGRQVSRTDPGQNGLPVLPMTFSLEAMAEAASLLVPGKVVIAIRNVRLFRWVPFDPEPTTLEVRASVAPSGTSGGVVEVTANVRDLG